MDTSSAIIGVVILLLFILPFVLMGMNKKKKAKQKLQKLRNFAGKHSCQISQFDFCGPFGIGIDETKNFVFFQKEINGNTSDQYVDLSNFKACKAMNTNRTVKQKEGNYTVIDKLELVFIPHLKSDTEKRLEFYNSDVNIQLHNELQILEKWAGFIDGKLKTK